MSDTPERLWTYQELAAHFRVTIKTVYRWFRHTKPCFSPTERTVRIPDSIVQQFISSKTKTTPNVKTI